MLCCTVDEQSIGSLSTSSMYRNLHSDPDQSPSSSGFFQSGYQHKPPPAPSYQTGGVGMPQTPNSSEAPYSRPGLGHEYSSQFFVSGINSHCHSEPGSTQPAWGSPTIYSSPTLPQVLGNAWEPINQYPSHHSAGPLSTPSTYPLSSPIGRPSLVNRPGSPVSSQGPLSGIECFSGGQDVAGAGSLQLPPMHPGAMSTQRRPYEWINKNAYQNPQAPQGKTRTKDKYRVVYSDHQRLELEKEFRFSRYITIRRKSELAAQLMLSERQVKIWFQNRRAKERKATKKGIDSNSRPNEEEDAEDAVGEASDNSGQGIESPPGTSSLQSLTPLGEIPGYDPVDHLPHSSTSIHDPQDGDTSQHSSTMSYLYNMTPHGYIPDIDIKPMLSGSDDTHGVTATLDDITLPQATSSSSIHQSPGKM